MPGGGRVLRGPCREALVGSSTPRASGIEYGGTARAAREGTPMQELRFGAVSEDGSYAVLAVPGRSGRYILPIDERLRVVAQGQTSRLAQDENEMGRPLRPQEVQGAILAG